MLKFIQNNREITALLAVVLLKRKSPKSILAGKLSLRSLAITMPLNHYKPQKEY